MTELEEAFQAEGALRLREKAEGKAIIEEERSARSRTSVGPSS